jgi:hypothetical protein
MTVLLYLSALLHLFILQVHFIQSLMQPYNYELFSTDLRHVSAILDHHQASLDWFGRVNNAHT